MMRSGLLHAAALAGLVLSACSPAPTPSPPADVVETAPAPKPAPAPPPAEPALPQQASDDWKVYAKPADVVRLSTLDAVWDKAIDRARSEGHEADLDALGAFAKRGAGLPVPFAPPGPYRCRTIQLGGEGPGPAYAASPFVKCQVELTPGGDLVLRRLEGAAFEGKLYPERATRLVYLGAMAAGAQRPAYGQSPDRDQVGAFERVGEGRYRLTLAPMTAMDGLDLVEVTK